MKYKLLILLFLIGIIYSQDLIWQDITDNFTPLPESIRLFKATRENPKLEIFYIDVDLSDTTIAVRSYLSADLKSLPNLSLDLGTIAAVNGGYFGGGVSYSSVIYPDMVKAPNVPTVTRNNKAYPVLRSLFSIDVSMNPSVDWIYHFDQSMNGIYAFDVPIDYDYIDPTPKSIPDKSTGRQLNLLTGIGGGPTMVKNGTKHITYNQEILWGSGVGLDNNDPRTAVGYTADNHIILITANGRQSQSEGVSLVELADILLDLDCVEAMNLDGGGSSQMTVGNTYVNHPSEYRAIPSILAVVHRDSLIKKNDDENALYFDTDDSSTEVISDGWFETANSGFWGDSPALLHPIGNGENQVKYNFAFNQDTECKVYGWWVAANNRCTDTPYVIRHKTGIDTVRVNQTENHANWNLLGTYTFGTRNNFVIINDDGTSGDYVVADGIKLVPSTITKIAEEEKTSNQFQLHPNYPNPFNPTTTISFSMPKSMITSLKIFNIKGEKIEDILTDKQLSMGTHQYQFDAKNNPSGIYFYQLTNENITVAGKMLLIK